MFFSAHEAGKGSVNQDIDRLAPRLGLWRYDDAIDDGPDPLHESALGLRIFQVQRFECGLQRGDEAAVDLGRVRKQRRRRRPDLGRRRESGLDLRPVRR